MWRRWLVGGVGGLVVASGLLAQPGTVRTRDGRTFSGDVDEQGDQVVVQIKGIETILNRTQVQRINYAQDLHDEYRQRLSRLGARDVQGRVEIARWLFQHHEYALARDTLETAEQIDARNDDVRDLLQTVNRQILLDRDSASAAPRNPQDPPPDDAGADQPPPRGQRERPASRPSDEDVMPILGPEQINLVRQEEWREGEKVNGIKFENDVRRRYITAKGMNAGQFNRMSPSQQAWEILQNGNKQMRQDVRLGDPPAIQEYKTIQRNLVAGCAAAGCHAGRKVTSKLMLYWPAADEAATYTNFVILQKFNEKVGDRQRQMINREAPKESLLYQYSLPLDSADVAHPKAGNYKGLVKTPNDVKLKQMVKWMGTDLKPVAPEYDHLLKEEEPTTKSTAGERLTGGENTQRPPPDRQPRREKQPSR